MFVWLSKRSRDGLMIDEWYNKLLKGLGDLGVVFLIGELLTLSIGSEQAQRVGVRFGFLGLCSDQEGWDRERRATVGRGEEEGDILHDRLVKLRRLVGKP